MGKDIEIKAMKLLLVRKYSTWESLKQKDAKHNNAEILYCSSWIIMNLEIHNLCPIFSLSPFIMTYILMCDKKKKKKKKKKTTSQDWVGKKKKGPNSKRTLRKT